MIHESSDGGKTIKSREMNLPNHKSSQTEISDEEIEVGAINFCIKNIDIEVFSWHDIFVASAKWYREQLKSRQ